MQIRPATPADVPRMRALEREAETSAHWAEREYDALFAPEAPKRLALVAGEGQGGIYGFIVARCGLEEWEIENVVVAPECRRGGVGTRLVQDVLHQAVELGATSVLLEVRESNRPARKLYERLGFVEVGRRNRYYENPEEDALLLKISVSVP